MLPFHEHGSPVAGRPSFLLLHYFGGSHREWQLVIDRMPGEHILAADLPGFGDAADLAGFTVQEMATAICELVERQSPNRVVLVGHSMSGKAAMLVAGNPPRNLTRLVLVAPSPLSGEPMDDETRASMAIANTTRERGEAFAKPGFWLEPSRDIFETAVQDILHTSDAACHAWPEHGTREDWSTRVTELKVPTTLVVGEHDRAISPEQQRRETLPLVEATGGVMHLLPETAHMVPYERPESLAAILLDSDSSS